MKTWLESNTLKKYRFIESKFLEKKDHLIDKLDLTDSQKEELKAFFAKHPSYENKVDWNNKSLSYKDFEPLLTLDGKSKTQAKKNGLSGLVEGKDYVDFGEADIEDLGRCHLYQPLSYLGSKTLASNNVPPIKGNGAKWCISYQKTDEYWRKYTDKGIKFLFVFTKDTKYALTLYPKTIPHKDEVYSFEDDNLGWPDWCESTTISHTVKEIFGFTALALNELLTKYKDILIKNPDDTIDCVYSSSIDLHQFIDNKGRFICQFGKWKGDFNANMLGIVSLEGCPKEVTGNFFCANNKLISLKGCPLYVGGSFKCNDNWLTSLFGCPETVGQDFDCRNNRLTFLTGCPSKIKGYFDCSGNNINFLNGCPKEVGYYFDCSYNRLSSLKDGPSIVGDEYKCNNNDLTSLSGSPKEINGDFECKNNLLTSLVGGPEKIRIDFDCRSNRLTSLDGSPSKIGYYFICDSYLKKEAEAKGYSLRPIY